MELPSRILQKAVDEISNLPGIGNNTALRMALHMLQSPVQQTQNLAKALDELVVNANYCEVCYQLCDNTLCNICSSEKRNKYQICVVEQLTDIIAIEKTGVYKGVYHVLGGRIDPMEGIGPEKLKINELIRRVDNLPDLEMIFAFSSTFEGDTTMFYLYKKLRSSQVTFFSLARGVGVGDELQYANSLSLAKSIENKVKYDAS